MNYDDVLEEVLAAGSDHLEVFGGRFVGGYQLQQCPEEFAKFVCLLSQLGPFPTYLEIGTAAGGVVRFLNERLSIDRNVIIDNGQHVKFPFWSGQNKQYVRRVTEFIGDSHSPEAEEFLQKLGIQFSLVGIDGDHAYEGVRADWELVQPYLPRGSLVWFHDIRACEGVARLWQEIRDRHTLLLETDQFGIGVLRVVRETA